MRPRRFLTLLPLQQLPVILPLCFWNFQHSHGLSDRYAHVFDKVLIEARIPFVMP
jgi:hypothetical protein